MKTLAPALCLLLVAALARAAPPPTTAPSPHRVPDGHVIEQVAGEAQGVRFPMFAAFDDRGRLFVTISSGQDLYAELQALKRSCHIRMLEDRDGDGRFETSTVFAENLRPSMGLVWRDGKLYAADPPDLVTLEDTDGDGRADQRTVVLTGFGHQDNGSLHGLTFGPDGLLYMTMGQPDGYKLRRADGSFLEGKSGALIRCRPDGSHPEVVSRGFENLVEVVFTARGEILGTVNWYQKPEGGVRDAIVHLADGGLYPYVPDTGTPMPVTGDPLPAVAKFPAVALSGLVLYRGQALRRHPDATAELLSAQHNSRKVQRHVITRAGATFVSRDEDLVASEHPDFHPSDVLEDADGSLLVVDTGGWYVQHCPTGKIRDSRAPGGIYRVRREGSPRVPRVRQPDRTAAYLSGAADVDALRRGAVDRDLDVVAASARGLGRRGEPGEVARLLRHADLSVRFAAAEALARCGTPQHLPAVWEALASTRPEDRMLEHALIHAAHRIADAAGLETALSHEHPGVRKAALLLLDQPPRKGAPVEAAVRGLSSPDPASRAAAAWVMRRHPEWAKEAAAQLDSWLADNALAADREAALGEWVIAFAPDARVQKLVADSVRSARTPPARRVMLLRAMAASGVYPLPDAWAAALGDVLEGRSAAPDARLEAVRTAAAVQEPKLDARLAAIAEDAREPPDVRREAVRAVVGRRPLLSPSTFDLLARQLAKDAPPLDRLAAAETLARATLDGRQLTQLLRRATGDALISPAVVLAAVARSPAGTAPDAATLAAYLADAVARGWRPAEGDADAALLKRLGDEQARHLRTLLDARRDSARARLDEYRPLLSGGDPARGKAVFFGGAVACSACHRVGPEGGDVGPDLTRVGAIRSGGDLLESILVPSSTLAQGYEPYAVTTRQGEVLAGVLERQDKPDEERIVLRDSAGTRHRLRKQDLRRLERAPLSVMPEGLERGLTKEQFRDLLAYLQSLK